MGDSGDSKVVMMSGFTWCDVVCLGGVYVGILEGSLNLLGVPRETSSLPLDAARGFPCEAAR